MTPLGSGTGENANAACPPNADISESKLTSNVPGLVVCKIAVAAEPPVTVSDGVA